MKGPSKDAKPLRYSTSFLRSRKEALWILIAFGFFLAWTVGYSCYTGYGEGSEPLRTVFGLPGWVFWGVLVPWAASLLFSIGFALLTMVDDPPTMVDRMKQRPDPQQQIRDRE